MINTTILSIKKWKQQITKYGQSKLKAVSYTGFCLVVFNCRAESKLTASPAFGAPTGLVLVSRWCLVPLEFLVGHKCNPIGSNIAVLN